MAASDTSIFEGWLKRWAIDPDQLSPEQLAACHDAYNKRHIDPIEANNMLRAEFLDYGLQYYVAGRCAVATGLNPVAANILHHAVEMFLKAGLCAHTTEDERKFQLRHNLREIWRAFKSHYDPEEKLAGFDDCVQELHNYEDIRYPEGMMRPGAIGLHMQFGGAPMVKGSLGGGDVKEYSLEMSKIDAFVKAIYEAAHLKMPKHRMTMYREPGKSYLREQNAEACLFE
jgi:hypothetical protein